MYTSITHLTLYVKAYTRSLKWPIWFFALWGVNSWISSYLDNKSIRKLKKGLSHFTDIKVLETNTFTKYFSVVLLYRRNTGLTPSFLHIFPTPCTCAHSSLCQKVSPKHLLFSSHPSSCSHHFSPHLLSPYRCFFVIFLELLYANTRR